MKLYETKEEAEANPEEGKVLYRTELLEYKRFGWCKRGRGNYMIHGIFSNLGGSVALANGSDKRGNKLLRIHSLPKDQALALLDELRKKIESNGQQVEQLESRSGERR